VAIARVCAVTQPVEVDTDIARIEHNVKSAHGNATIRPECVSSQNMAF
jgi:hypothetical protein